VLFGRPFAVWVIGLYSLRDSGGMWTDVKLEGAEIKGLDGERKALVYDNYSKLITATDTIRKVRHPQSTLSQFLLKLTNPLPPDAHQHGPPNPHHLHPLPRHLAHSRNRNLPSDLTPRTPFRILPTARS